MKRKIVGLVVICLITCSFAVIAGGAEEAAEPVDLDAPRGAAVFAGSGFGGQPVDAHYFISAAEAPLMGPTYGVGFIRHQDPETAELRPGIAESWEVTEDFKTWTFHIRRGVKFPLTGNPVTAHDWVYGHHKILAGAAEASRQGSHKVLYDDIWAEDDYTLKVRVNQPNAILAASASVYGARGFQHVLVDSKYCEEIGYAEFRRRPSTLGWYQAKDWRLGEYTILEAPDDAVFPWAEPSRASVKEITFLVVPETLTRLAMVRTGQVDIAGDLIGPAIPEAIADRRLRVETSRPSAVHELVLTEMLYPDEPHPVHDVRVRRAMSYAIDREALIDVIYYGQAEVATIPSVQNWIPGADPTIPGYPYDPQKAKALLAEAGYPNGFKYKISSTPVNMDHSLAIQAFWGDIGIDAEVVPVEGATHTRSLSEKTIRGAWISRATTRAEPIIMNSYYYIIGATWSWSKDEVLGAIVDDILATPDYEERLEKQKAFCWYLHENQPRVPTGAYKSVYALGPKIDRFVPGLLASWVHAEWLTLKD